MQDAYDLLISIRMKRTLLLGLVLWLWLLLIGFVLFMPLLILMDGISNIEHEDITIALGYLSIFVVAFSALIIVWIRTNAFYTWFR